VLLDAGKVGEADVDELDLLVLDELEQLVGVAEHVASSAAPDAAIVWCCNATVRQFLDRQRFVSGMLQVPDAVSDTGLTGDAYPRVVQTVSLGRRLVALVVDWVIAMLSAAVVARISVPPEGVREGLVVSAVFIVEVGVLVGLLGFSIGKRVVVLRVEGPDGRPIGVLRGLLRTFLLSLVLPALVMTEDRRGLHDLAARSRVVAF
jgi:uncharacterized RDD family membrane protein YckC